MLDVLIARLVFLAVVTGSAFYFRPLNWPPLVSAVAGLALGAGVLLAEMRIREMSLKRLIGAALGALVGGVGASLMSWALAAANPNHSPTLQFFQLGLLLWGTYVGLAVGANKGELLDLTAFGGVLGRESHMHKASKILDTSVIIDGRIADIADTGFLDSVLVIPQFVLRELQLVADSSDSMKRNRGRRGLDVLQRIQKMPHLQVQIVEDDFPAVREVDMKLIELAKLYEAKIVTNDFNLNKVAQLRGVEVLNINELANSLKPIVLPGELMRVFILKEGKEFNQGVAYLDDGTMVVVDNAKRMIAKTIDICVTSVLQTTAGKMIFGKYDDRAHATVSEPRPARREQAVGES